MSWRETLNLNELFIGNKKVPLKVYDIDIIIGFESGNKINIFTKWTGANDGPDLVDEVAVADFYFSDDQEGLIPSTVAASGGISDVGIGKIIEERPGLSGKIITRAAGSLIFSCHLNHGGVETWYFVIVQKNGVKTISGPITFA